MTRARFIVAVGVFAVTVALVAVVWVVTRNCGGSAPGGALVAPDSDQSSSQGLSGAKSDIVAVRPRKLPRRADVRPGDDSAGSGPSETTEAPGQTPVAAEPGKTLEESLRDWEKERLTREFVESFTRQIGLTREQVEAAQPAVDRLTQLGRKNAQVEFDYKEALTAAGGAEHITSDTRATIDAHFRALKEQMLPEVIEETIAAMKMLRPYLNLEQAATLDEMLQGAIEARERLRRPRPNRALIPAPDESPAAP